MDWSPFYCLPKAELTPSGLIQLDTADNEVLLLRRPHVEFRHDGPTPMAPRPRSLKSSEQWKSSSSNMIILMITTHRFVLMYKQQQQQQQQQQQEEQSSSTNIATTTTTTKIDARFVHLSNVKKIDARGGPSLMSPNSSYKIVLTTQTYDDLILVFRNSSSSNTTTTTDTTSTAASMMMTMASSTFSPSSSSSSSSSYSSSYSSPKDDRDQSIQELRKALERKRWEVAARLHEKTANAEHASGGVYAAINNNKVGLDRILAKNKMRHRENAKLAEQALSGDSENLLEEAAELLKVIQKYTVLVQKFESSSNNNNNNNNDNDEDKEAALKLKGLLSDMGMTSALSQSKMAGGGGGGGGSKNYKRGSQAAQQQRDYHELTARQVADFLVPRLRTSVLRKGRTTNCSNFNKSNSSNSNSTNNNNNNNNNNQSGGGGGSGMMSLTDVYCLFNRARGTNLISPEDLRDSCSLLGELNIGLSQRTFPSGVVVLQLDDLALSPTNYEARRTMIDLCSTSHNGNNSNSNSNINSYSNGGTTALEASHVLRLSPLLASEQLEEAERLGWLCRDATLSTVRFYPNKFLTSF